MIKMFCDKCGKECANAYDIKIGVLQNPCPVNIKNTNTAQITDDNTEIRMLLCQDCYNELNLPNVYMSNRAGKLVFNPHSPADVIIDPDAIISDDSNNNNGNSASDKPKQPEQTARKYFMTYDGKDSQNRYVYHDQNGTVWKQNGGKSQSYENAMDWNLPLYKACENQFNSDCTNECIFPDHNVVICSNDRTKTLNLTVNCQAVYNTSVDVPAELNFDDAIEYANSMGTWTRGALDYIPGSDEIDVENSDFD